MEPTDPFQEGDALFFNICLTAFIDKTPAVIGAVGSKTGIDGCFGPGIEFSDQ